MQQNVVIGIVSKHPRSNQTSRPCSLIQDEVKQAIFDNGAIAIGILPPAKSITFANDNWEDQLSNKEMEDLIKQIDLCDGLILQGGLETERYECWIAKYAYEKDIPILGICAGQNNLVRALSGTTYQIPNPEQHDVSFHDYVHSVVIKESSKFYSIVKRNSMKVNSMHRRAIDECPLLDKVGFCEDGYPDVVESPDKDFYIGVRFHPESLYQKDEAMNRIFLGLIESCWKNKRKSNMELEQAIQKRRSIRKYKSNDVSEELIYKLMKSAQAAPSAKNRQPWFFLIVKKEKKDQIADLMLHQQEKTPIQDKKNSSVAATAKLIKEAPILILVWKEKANNWLIGDHLSIGAAIQNICLTATASGLGSLWIRDIVSVREEVAQLVGYPHLELNSAIAIGYADEDPSPRPRKGLDEIMKFL